MNSKPYFRSVGITLLTGIFAVGLFLFAVTLSPANVQAASSQLSISDLSSSITSTVYLPLIFRSNDPAMPTLTSPLNGAILDTLIPTFIWDTGIQPANTIGCLAFSTTPHPTGCRMSYSIDYYGSHRERVMWYNLSPSTIYYWRVGAVYNNDIDHPKWSEEWSFTTGTVGGTILPAPILQSPANNSIISTSNVTLTWHPVAGAIEYVVTLHGLDTDSWASFRGTTTTQQVIDIANFVQIGFGNNFEWYVETRNGYAWSDSSEKWKFTYSANISSNSPTRFRVVRLKTSPVQYWTDVPLFLFE